MNLILEAIGPNSGKHSNRTVISPSGGSIGRLPENSLVLDDPHVSGRHAVIQYADGVYYLEDKSRNGISINTLENRLEKGGQYRLNAGDRIFIEPYEITVSLTTPSRIDPTDPFKLPASGQTIGSDSDIGSTGLDEGFDRSSIHHGSDLIEGLVGPSPRQAAEARGARDLQRKSVLDDHIRPPARAHVPAPPPTPSGSHIPAEWNDSGIIKPNAAPPVDSPPRSDSNPAKRAATPSSTAESDLAAVLAAAGLEDVRVTRELAEDFGQILRVVVTGVMDILQARQHTKDEFGMPLTTFKRAANNPLKFSANVEDALHNLLVKRNAAYLGPVDSFVDAFDDLRNHQMAVLAGVRQAFNAMLAQFDPDELEQQFDRQVNKGALVKVPAKLRYWELYRQWIHDMVGDDPESTYSKLFGEEFARAYEAQLKELKAHGSAKKP